MGDGAFSWQKAGCVNLKTQAYPDPIAHITAAIE